MGSEEEARGKGAPAKGTEAGDRQARLAAAMRENLRRRKAQSRAREPRPPGDHPAPDGPVEEGGGSA